MEREFSSSPEHIAPVEQTAEQQPVGVDYSNKMELEYLARMHGLTPETVHDLESMSPEIHKLFEHSLEQLRLNERLMQYGQEQLIKRELSQLFENKPAFPDHLLEEMAPIHQYFKLLIKEGQATQDDERAYFNKRYGWSEEPFDLSSWDNKLASLAHLVRQKVTGRISPQEFDQQISSP